MILVTGGTGLVGSYLLLELTKKDNPIRAIYRSKSSIEKTKNIFDAFQAMERFKKIEWFQANITNYFKLKDAFQGVSKVYHAAAKVSFAGKDADEMMKTNIEGTTHIANLSLEMKIDKLCYISSVSSLGSYAKGCTDEEALWQKTDTTSLYSISKYYAENEVWRASEEGLDVVIVNPTTIMGYGDWRESSLTIIKKVADGLSFYPPGSNGFIGVKDVSTVAITLMNSDIKGQRYILAAENISFKNLLSTIAIALGKKPPKYAAKKWMATSMLFGDQLLAMLSGKKAILNKGSIHTAFNRKCFDTDKIKKEIGYTFQPISEVIQEAAIFYKRQL